jgi:hypothetical protein
MFSAPNEREREREREIGRRGRKEKEEKKNTNILKKVPLFFGYEKICPLLMFESVG